MNIDLPVQDVPGGGAASAQAALAPGATQNKTPARGRELVLYAVLVGIGVYSAVEATRFPRPFPTGPGLVPMIAAGILAVLGAAGIVKVLLGTPQPLEPIAWSRVARLGAAVIAYLLLLQALSFLAATFIGGMLVSESARDARDVGRLHRHWQELSIVVVIVVGIYLLFQDVLHTQLP
ncbi:MAG: tripartite tricarboxylate transporter TctB family protein [Actinomycetota bacterium]|nr:tripartite tricarboxylate transporter TctB family protein [Actinomycetota bacterium]